MCECDGLPIVIRLVRLSMAPTTCLNNAFTRKSRTCLLISSISQSLSFSFISSLFFFWVKLYKVQSFP